MPPGLQLTARTEEAWQRGLDRLTDDELIGVLRAARRLASRAAALELSVMADLAARRRAVSGTRGGPSAGEHVDAEIAAALTLTTHSAAVLQDLALGVTRLPGTLKALAAGRIDQPRAAVIANGTSALDDLTAGHVSALVIGAAPGQTTGQLRAAVQQTVMFFDPEAARRRKEAAQKQARVELWREPAGTCTLAGRDLPPAFALAADKHLTAVARLLRQHGADGSLGQLRAQAFLNLLTGQPLITPAPGSAGAAQAEAPGAPHERQAGGARPDGGGLPGLSGSVNLTLPLTTWLGWSQTPGQVPGFGPLDARDSRILAAMLARQPGTQWCLTLTNQEGHAVAHGCAPGSPGPPPGSTARSDTDPPGGNGPPGDSGPPGGNDPPGDSDRPGGNGPPGDTDPPRGNGPARGNAPPGGSDPAGGDGRPGGKGRPGGNRPLRGNAPVGGSDPPGSSDQPKQGASHAPRAGSPPQGRGQSGAHPLGAWLSRMTIHPLTGPCDHAYATAAYRPSRQLRHLARIRHQTCTRPGCRRPAGQCDLDHTVPHDQGGLTCLCNIGPASKS